MALAGGVGEGVSAGCVEVVDRRALRPTAVDVGQVARVAPAATTAAAASAPHPARFITGATVGTITTCATAAKREFLAHDLRECPQGADGSCRSSRERGPEEARVGEQRDDADEAAGVSPAVATDGESLDQPEDEATEHALRLMDEALRRNDAAQRWLVAGDS
jgi:hypothetical protein